jgi:hypothetical protein
MITIIQVVYGTNHLVILFKIGKNIRETDFLTKTPNNLTGRVITSGCNEHGQLGRYTTNLHINNNFDYINDINFKDIMIAKIACGNSHTLILLENGKVLSCGDNKKGQLGRNCISLKDNYIFDYIDDTNFKDDEIIDIICNGDNSYIIFEDNKCLLLSDKNFPLNDILIDINNISIGEYYLVNNRVLTYENYKVIQIEFGDKHKVILLENGDVLSCGNNKFGQLGHSKNYNTYKNVDTFTKINRKNIGNIPIKKISCKSNNTIILLENGYVLTCGQKDYLWRNICDDTYLFNYINNKNFIGLKVKDISQSNFNLAILLEAKLNIADDYKDENIICDTFTSNNRQVLTCGSNYSGQLGRTYLSDDNLILDYLDNTLLYEPITSFIDSLIESI